jgi:hypothetical protein
MSPWYDRNRRFSRKCSRIRSAAPQEEKGMALTEYEERVIAELEMQLRAGDSVLDDSLLSDSVWLKHFEARAMQGSRSVASRLVPLVACLLGGMALLVEARHTWLLVGMSNVSGLSSTSITRALGVAGWVMVLGSAIMLRRLFRDARRHALAAGRAHNQRFS